MWIRRRPETGSFWLLNRAMFFKRKVIMRGMGFTQDLTRAMISAGLSLVLVVETFENGFVYGPPLAIKGSYFI